MVDWVTLGAPGGPDVAGRSLERTSREPVHPTGLPWAACTAGPGSTPGCANAAVLAAGGAGAELAVRPPVLLGRAAGGVHAVFARGPTATLAGACGSSTSGGGLVRDFGGDEVGAGPRDLFWDGRDGAGDRRRRRGYVFALEIWPVGGAGGLHAGALCGALNGGGGLAAAAVWLACSHRRPAGGGGLREVGDGWLLAPADTAALLARRRAAGPPGRGGCWFTVGQARLWGMPELPLREVAGGRGVRRGPLGGGAACGTAPGGTLLVVDRQAAWIAWRRRWEVRLEAGREQVRVAGAVADARTDLDAGRRAGPGPGGGGRLRLRVWTPLGAAVAGDRRLRPAIRAVLRPGRHRLRGGLGSSRRGTAGAGRRTRRRH